MESIQNDCVVEIHYQIKSQTGEVLDTTMGFSPLPYIHGKGNIIPGLERALNGKKLGEEFKGTIPFLEAYGEKRADLIQTVSKDKFKNQEEIQIGHQFRIATADGQSVVVCITDIREDEVVLDANHPLAGLDLHFELKVVSIRQATEEELHHGHLHMGAGCCGGGDGGCGRSCSDDDHC